MAEYAVIVRVRDPNRKDTEHQVIVDVPAETPRDLHAEVAGRIAAGKVREGIAVMPHLHLLTIHGVSPYSGDDGNAGNPAQGVQSGRIPLQAAADAPARGKGGRFVRSAA